MKFDTKRFYLLAILAVTALYTGCSSEDPEPVNEEELITTLEVTFTGTGPNEGESVVATFKDMDGVGGADPEITNPVTLKANGTYDVAVRFLNETETPAEEITLEVEEESDEHQLFFSSTGFTFTYQYNDEDVNGRPIGLDGSVIIGNAGSGQLTIQLIHQPDKAASGVSSGDPTNAGGETDISVTFNVNVE